MATKTKAATQEATVSEAFRQRLMARYEDDSVRGMIKSFATAYFNNGPNAFKRPGMEISTVDAAKCNWLHEINEENAKKYGYKLNQVKRGASTTDVMTFDKFYCHIIQMSDKLIEYTGTNAITEREIDGKVVKRYDQVGIVENADGTFGADRNLYFELRERFPAEFSTRRYFLVMITDENGEQLHSLPICLSLKGTALVSFEQGLNGVATSIGALESQIIGKQDASPLSVIGLSGYNLFVETEVQEVSNGEQSSDITGVKSIGGVDISNIEQRFNVEKEEMFHALREANKDFQVKYNRQLIREAGIGHTKSLAGSSVDDSEPLALPDTVM